MKKVKLSIDSLCVESFATAPAERGNGTIFGNAKTVDTCNATACPSWIDDCPSANGATLPCNGCVGTELC